MAEIIYKPQIDKPGVLINITRAAIGPIQIVEEDPNTPDWAYHVNNQPVD